MERHEISTIPSVTELISERVKSESKPCSREDPFKVALVIEGGAMRGVVAAGMATALASIGAVDSFDAIYGSSAGACAALYLKADQAPLGTSIYYQDLTGKEWIDMNRPIQGKPIVDIPFLVYNVMRTRKKLAWEKIRDSVIPIKIPVTEATNPHAEFLSSFNSQEEILDTLHWACRILVVAGMPIKVGSRYYTDGSILSSIPIEQALQDKSTHVLVLLTRPTGKLPKNNFFLDQLTAFLVRKDFPELAKIYLQRYMTYQMALNIISTSKENPNVLPVIQDVSVPSGTPEISRLEQRSTVLRNAALAGFNKVVTLFQESGLMPNPSISIN